MNPNHVNYDDIAATYDARYASRAGEGQHTIPPALRELLRPGRSNRILEVGCGTGFWLDSFGDSHEVYGLDLSHAMLCGAKKRHADVIRGSADQLPFPDRSFDVVYCVNALHHFSRKQTFIAEAARLLRGGGSLAITGMDPHGQHDTWYIYDYFPGTREMDLLRFPSAVQITGWMRDAGFNDIGDRVVERIINHQHGRAVLNHSVLQKNGTSQLILISDEEYARGLGKLKADLEQAELQGNALTFPEDIALVMVSGRRSTVLSE